MRRSLRHRRTEKEIKRDQEDHFADLAEHEPSEHAKKWMQRGAYSVEDCLRKWGVDTKGSVASGELKLKKYIPNKARLKRIDARIFRTL